jgi:hypothetical protein
MTELTASFIYMLTLAVIQPARIQDIEESAPKLTGDAGQKFLEAGAFRAVHDVARDTGLVIAVRKGVYVLSRSATESLRSNPISSRVDNRRLFLIKEKRKKIV